MTEVTAAVRPASKLKVDPGPVLGKQNLLVSFTTIQTFPTRAGQINNLMIKINIFETFWDGRQTLTAHPGVGLTYK